MTKPSADELLFSVKCFAAAMLAFYVALRIGLTRPYWAVTTSYIVAQPLSGAVLSKAAFRLMGTVLGATAAVVLVPAFVNEPLALSAALAIWLGVCLYISLLDRTPRAYTFLLAGYTASIIGFPSVDTPGTIFDTAALRVQEITIGILCGSLVHGLIFPRTVTARLMTRIDTIIHDAERWSREALGGSERTSSPGEQRRIALDLTELDQLSVHLPFDTARLLPRVRTVRALQDRLLELLPLGSTVEDRLDVLKQQGGVPGHLAGVIADVAAWLAGDIAAADRDEHAARLIERSMKCEPHPEDPVWRRMLVLNLRVRLVDLIACHRDIRDLREQISSPSVRAISPHVADLLSQAYGRAHHLDRGLALRAALGTFACIILGCAFWIGVAWPDGAGAVLIAGVCCALFGNVDRPGPNIVLFLVGSFIGLLVALVYAFSVMPRVTTLEMFALVMAPVLLTIGIFLARPHPKFTLVALGALLGFINTVGFSATYDASFTSFVNGGLAQLLGTGFAVITVGLFQTIGTEHSVGRLFRAAWRDVARRAEGRDRDERRWASRMLDRVGLLLPRLTTFKGQAEAPDTLMDALVDMRIGIVSGRLRAIGDQVLPEEREAILTTLKSVGRHFRALNPARPVPPPRSLLEEIDRSVAVFAGDEDTQRRREGLVLLTSLRRNLFPAAPDYEAAA